jgi:hypothetical protein
MSKQTLACAAMLVSAVSATCLPVGNAQETKATAKKGEKPAASPGWLVVEEGFWFPLRFEPLHALDNARYHNRRHEEKAAADELDKAVSWLNLAAGHGLPITADKLTGAANELRVFAKDLRSGKLNAAEQMDASLAKAAQALAEWHFYKAKESWGKSEEVDAGYDLEMAAHYLQHAADSAHHQFGPDTREVITRIYHDGKVASEAKTFDHNTLGMQLEAIEKAINELGKTMVKSPT